MDQPSKRSYRDDDDNNSVTSSKKARMDEFMRVLVVEIHGVPKAEPFELIVLHETKQAKMRTVPQRLSIWHVCTWQGAAHGHTFENGILDALKANKCFVSMVKAESEALDEIVEDCSSTGHVICLAEEGGNLPQLDDMHVLFVPSNTSSFREVYYYMHQRIPPNMLGQVFQGFIVVGQNLLPPECWGPGFVGAGETNDAPAATTESPPTTSPAPPAPAAVVVGGNAEKGGGGASSPAHHHSPQANGSFAGGSGTNSLQRRDNMDRSSSPRRRDDRDGRRRGGDDDDSPRRRRMERNRNGDGGGSYSNGRGRSPPRHRSPEINRSSARTHAIRRGKKSCCWGQRCYGKPAPEGNGKCIHLHPGDAGFIATKECNFGNDCRKRKEKQCIFVHPDEMKRGGGGGRERGGSDSRHNCRLGADCRDFRDGKCDRLHPGQAGYVPRSRSRSRSPVRGGRSRDRGHRSRSRSPRRSRSRSSSSRSGSERRRKDSR